MLKSFLESITTSRLWQQARTIWRVATGSGSTRTSEALDLYLSGMSVQKISALLMPGIGGPALVARQLDIQAEIREYALEQEKLVLELKDEVAELRAALDAVLKAAAKPEAPAAPDLLGELLVAAAHANGGMGASV